MRFFTLFALSGLATVSLASPVAVVDNSLDKRQTGPVAALTLLTDLLSSVQVYTAAINATSATITSDSTDADKAAAISSIGASITSITAEVATAATSAGALSAVTKRGELVTRQVSVGTIVAALQALLTEIVNTVNGLVANLGLTGLLSFLNPLLAALGALVLSLIPVVDGLLALVEQLLDGILLALGTALLGLTL